MAALAYYTAAVQERERDAMPIIGPSVDRRTLTLLCRLANSDTVCSLVCFACAQIHRWVASWEKLQPDFGESFLHRGQRADIAYHKESQTKQK